MDYTIGETLICPECGNLIPASTREAEAACDDCGSHAAVICPCCDEIFDFIYTKFESAEA